MNNFVRGAIWLHQQGRSIRDIETTLHTHFTTVGDVVKECEEGNFVKEEIPQPKETPEKVVQRRKLVSKLHKKDKLDSSAEIAVKLWKLHKISVSARTVQRDNVANGGRHLVHLAVPKLTEAEQPRLVGAHVEQGGEETPRH